MLAYKVLFVFLFFLLDPSLGVEESENRSVEISARGGFVERFVPRPIRNLFGHREETSSEKTSDNEENRDEDDKKEHGSLDFVGRDIIRKVGKTIGTVRDKIGFSSNASTGLDCDKSFFSGLADGFKNKVRAIYPGTKWCGDGNKSKSYDDLGKFNDTDSCCREHDLCPNAIPAGETKHGLINTGLFTRSHCDCDRKFYDCLKTTGSVISRKIGLTYFSVLGPQCFRKDYKVIDCRKEEGYLFSSTKIRLFSMFSRGKCVEYRHANGGDQIFQWFDTPKF